MLQQQVTILVVIIYLALAACMESQKTSAPLPAPTVYEWMGAGPTPSLPRLAQDKSMCFREAELTDTQKAPGVVSDHWKAHVKLCMPKAGLG